MPRILALALVVVGGTLVITLPVSAQQQRVQFSFAVGGLSTKLNTDESAAMEHLSGLSTGLSTTATYRRIGLNVRYLEGSLESSGGATSRDIVEGEAMFSVRALRWLHFSFGRHIRSFIRSDGTQRWLFWEARVRTKARLGTPRLVSSLELSHVLSGNVNAAEPFDGGKGMEAELRWTIFPRRSLWMGFGYRIDRSHLGGGSRTEVVEHIQVTLGYGHERTN